MTTATISAPFALRPRGYSVSYHPGEVNHCPGCGRQHWIVGRMVAECAFCGTALSLMHVHGYGAVQRYATRAQPLHAPAAAPAAPLPAPA